MSTVTDLEEYKSAHLQPFRLGKLELQGHRIRLHCDCSLTRSAAVTLAQNLLELAKQLPKGAR